MNARLVQLKPGRTLLWASLIVSAVIVLGPFLWITSAAFKRPIDILLGKVRFKPVLSNFDELLFSKGSDFALNFANSMIVGLASTAIVLVITSMAAYAMYRLKWPRWVVPVLMLWTVIFHMIPPVVIVTAWFVMFQIAGFLNTYAGLIVAHVTINLPLGLWLMSAFVRDVPKEIEEAARIDGCGHVNLFVRIVLPLLLPGLVATAILVFIFSWNEFPIALSLTSRATQTVPVGIAKFAQEFEIKFGPMAAGAVFSTVPALILLLFGQRFIVKGLLAGSVK